MPRTLSARAVAHPQQGTTSPSPTDPGAANSRRSGRFAVRQPITLTPSPHQLPSAFTTPTARNSTTTTTSTTNEDESSDSDDDEQFQRLTYVEPSAADSEPFKQSEATTAKDVLLVAAFAKHQGCNSADINFDAASIKDFATTKIKSSIDSFNAQLGHTICTSSLKTGLFSVVGRVMKSMGQEMPRVQWMLMKDEIYRQCRSNSIPRHAREPLTLNRTDLGYILSLASHGADWFVDFKYLCAGVSSGIRKGSLDHHILDHIKNVNVITDKASPDFGKIEVEVAVPNAKFSAKLIISRNAWYVGSPTTLPSSLNYPDLVEALDACIRRVTGVGILEYWKSAALRAKYSVSNPFIKQCPSIV
jgi:hypothetical protein